MTSKHRTLLILLALDLLAGGYISYRLYNDSILIKATGASSGSCSQAFGSSCDPALSHANAVFLNLAWPIWSGAFYFMLFGLLIAVSAAAWRGQQVVKTEGSPWVRFLTLSFTGAVVVSAFLAYVNYTQLTSPCPMCTGLYIVNALGFGLVLALRPGKPGEILGGLGDVLKSSQVQSALVTFTIALFGFAWLYNSRIDEMRKLSKEQGEMAAQGIQTLRGPTVLDVSLAPTKGSANAKVQLVEFSDFECPYCSKFAQETKQLQERFPGDQLSISFLHYPLDHACNPNVTRPFHQSACKAASASICAQKLGDKFWDMHDALFAFFTTNRELGQHDKPLTDNDIVALSTSIKLDPEQMMACIRSPETLARIQLDIAQADTAKVSGTPTWFLNGHDFRADKIAPIADTIEPLIKRLLDLAANPPAADKK